VGVAAVVAVAVADGSFLKRFYETRAFMSPRFCFVSPFVTIVLLVPFLCA
jgi:hypothetical protein